jgi:thiosulfate:glutathione sulfurtransferase
MFTTTLSRTAWQAAKSSSRYVLTRPLHSGLVRYQDGGAPSSPDQSDKERLKQAQQWADGLRRDWDAKVITYRELKPKSEQPSTVRFQSACWTCKRNPHSQDAYLIDVREPDEVIQGMIPSAVNIPLSILPNALQLSGDAFRQKFGFDKPKTKQEVTFYCRSGKRSTTACDVAKRNGYTKCVSQQHPYRRSCGLT